MMRDPYFVPSHPAAAIGLLACAVDQPPVRIDLQRSLAISLAPTVSAPVHVPPTDEAFQRVRPEARVGGDNTTGGKVDSFHDVAIRALGARGNEA